MKAIFCIAGRNVKGIEYFNFHVLRHYFASQALLQDIPQKYIAELMGHSSVKLLESIYQHTFPDAKAEFANRIMEHSNNLFSE